MLQLKHTELNPVETEAPINISEYQTGMSSQTDLTMGDLSDLFNNLRIAKLANETLKKNWLIPICHLILLLTTTKRLSISQV